MSTSDNIILIGFMGSGKSTVGKKLAKETGRRFYDTDTMIEEAQQRSISDIFRTEGETYFRACERATMRTVATSIRHAVVATGGGLPIMLDDLREAGTVVYLNVPFERIAQRLGEEGKARRPLFADAHAARLLYETREPIYRERADMIVDGTLPCDDVVREICARFQQKNPTISP